MPPRPARCLLLLAGLSLAGCGFHLRGEVELPPQLAAGVHVSGDDRALAAALAAAGVGTQTAAGAQGAARLDLLETSFERRVLTIDAQGRATAYALHYRVEFAITAGGGEPRTAAIALQRSYDYDPARALQAEGEVRALQDEMRREAAAQILRQLARGWQ